jgi:hypothetical protein
MNALIPQTEAEAYRASTNAAGLCKKMVIETAMEIQGRKYVKVEGWQSIAIAHGCTASARDVERIEGGVRAIGEIRRMSDGVVIAEAEGFVGEDEPTWFGGEVTTKWGTKTTLKKRADYAIRAMAQTRAISRACRSAFAHVVVMMNAGLSTTPAEEVPLGGFEDERSDATPPRQTPATGQPGAIKRLSSAKAKELGIDREINAAIDGCTTRTELAEWDCDFDRHTAQCPLSWLDAIHNRVILRGEEIDREQGDDALDAEFREVVGA